MKETINLLHNVGDIPDIRQYVRCISTDLVPEIPIEYNPRIVYIDTLDSSYLQSEHTLPSSWGKF